MNSDRLAILTSLSFLSILWLPRAYLLLPCYAAVLLLLYALLLRRMSWLLLSLIVGYIYFSVLQVSERAGQISTAKQQVQFQIVQLLKQSDYQTAIAQLTDGKRIYLTWQAEHLAQLEQRYQATLAIRPISSRLNIGNFDRQRWYFAHHIEGIATVRHAELLPSAQPSFRTRWLEKVKQQTDSLRTQGLLLALAFGERTWLINDDWQRFQQTATAHLIAISGLHIGLAFMIGFVFAKGIQWLLLRVGWLQAVGFSLYFARMGGLLFALGYSYLAGFAVPTVRAVLAIVVVLFCQTIRRHYTSLQLWWRVVALLLLLDPLSVLSDSFWLSILAVLSLILWYRYFPLAKFPVVLVCKKLPKFDRLWCSLLHLQLGIWLMFLPVQFFFFEGFSSGALVANLLIVPLYSFLLVPLILFSLLTADLLHTWRLANWLAQCSLKLLEPLAHWISLSQYAQGIMLTLNLTILLVLYGWIQQKEKHYWIKAVAFPVLVIIVVWIFELRKPQVQWLTFDVGQGLAQALIYRNASGQKQAIFYDTGASWGDDKGQNSMAKLEILPYLQRHGIAVEAIFLSHDDNDHAGGVRDLLQHYPDAKLISPSRISYGAQQIESCQAGKQWHWGKFELSAIYPNQLVQRAKNEDSCIILVKFDRLRWLWTGDTTVAQEQQFAAQVGKLDFLQLGHHGSKTSTSETLLAQTKPSLAIASAGRWNPWHMPNKQVVERLARYQIPLLNTAEVGMVEINFSGNEWWMRMARDEGSAWYRQMY